MTYFSPSTGRAIRAVLFDTFGTVVDWRTGIADEIAKFFIRHGIDQDPVAFADAWRNRYQPSMEAVRSGERGFVALDVLHRENLADALTAAGIDPARFTDAELDDVNAAWERLPAWTDSAEGIRRIGATLTVGPLSNANTALLVNMARHAGLPWRVILGLDTVGAYKPDARAYRGMAALLRLDPGEVMLAAAHNEDLAAARAAGLATGFVLRPQEHGPQQTTNLAAESSWDIVAASITDLATQLGAS